MNIQTPKLLVIVGETASGKSALAVKLAKRMNGELICADSWTVRREVDIGTAKPTKLERADVPHHLLDVAGPDEDFTAAVFKRMATQAIDDIAAGGKLPIMVGATGLYIDSVLYDYQFLPAGDRDEREALNALSAPELVHKAQQFGLDPAQVDQRNKRRLIRLIETRGAIPQKQSLRDGTLVIGLRTDNDLLNKRIEQRIDAMLMAGLEAEVKNLVDKYGWDCEALKGVGYAQWRGYFEGKQSQDETRQKIIKATKDLAKRQRTWFKRNNSIQWYDTPVNLADIVERVTTFFETKA